MVFPAPTLADPKAAVPVHVTTSAPTTPVSAQLVTVALVVPSYGLFATATVGVTVTAVIAAVVVAVVDASVYSLAAAPDSVSPLTVTVLPVPTLADANAAVPVHLPRGDRRRGRARRRRQRVLARRCARQRQPADRHGLPGAHACRPKGRRAGARHDIGADNAGQRAARERRARRPVIRFVGDRDR